VKSKEELIAFFQERLERERQSITVYSSIIATKKIGNPKLEALLKMIVNDSENHIKLYGELIERLKQR